MTTWNCTYVYVCTYACIVSLHSVNVYCLGMLCCIWQYISAHKQTNRQSVVKSNAVVIFISKFACDPVNSLSLFSLSGGITPATSVKSAPTLQYLKVLDVITIILCFMRAVFFACFFAEATLSESQDQFYQ